MSGGDPVAGRRVATVRRTTRETDIALTLDLDGSGATDVRTGIAFYDHLLSSLAYHAGFDLRVEATGDLEVDDHHTAADAGPVPERLGERRAE